MRERVSVFWPPRTTRKGEPTVPDWGAATLPSIQTPSTSM